MPKNYKFHPTDAEWHRLQQMSDFLEPFDQITNLISGLTYPTSNLYFMQVWNIQNWLTVNESSQDEVIRNMIVLMKERFDKYWAEVSDIFAIATVFDPRLKLTLADYCFAKLDISTREKRMKHLRAQLRKLFEVYENKSSAVSPTTESREDVTRDDETAKGNFSNYDDFFAFRKANVVANGKSTLDMYLDEPAMNVKGFKSLDILNYWKDNGPRFGKLASMACDILSIPITTVASESSFSIGTRVLSKYRSRLLPRNVQALICSRNWLKGFESYENGK
ncbi:putative HAT dimerization domain, ribonuclease H-like superfamily, hAT-like transposase, RNase-H [Arabidopsis thaliana]